MFIITNHDLLHSSPPDMIDLLGRGLQILVQGRTFYIDDTSENRKELSQTLVFHKIGFGYSSARAYTRVGGRRRRRHICDDSSLSSCVAIDKVKRTEKSDKLLFFKKFTCDGAFYLGCEYFDSESTLESIYQKISIDYQFNSEEWQLFLLHTRILLCEKNREDNFTSLDIDSGSVLYIVSKQHSARFETMAAPVTNCPLMPKENIYSPNGPQIQQFLPSMFGDTSISDVTIIVDGCRFPAHKVILFQNPYFKTLLSSGFKEKTSNEVILHGMSSECARIIIGHLYSIPIPSGLSPSSLVELLDFSIQHICNELQSSVIQKMKMSVDGHNALLFLTMCQKYEEFYDMSSLKEVCLTTVVREIKVVFSGQCESAAYQYAVDYISSILNSSSNKQ